MEQTHRITRALHDDHVAVIALLRRLTNALNADYPGGAPDLTEFPAGPDDGSRLAALLGALAAAVEGEVAGHFALEELGLFPLLEAAGEGAFGEALAEEHRVILPLGRRLAGLARAGLRDGFDASAWREFRRLGLDFAARLTEHAEKEEIGLLPVLDEILEDEDDNRLADGYLSGAAYLAGTGFLETSGLPSTQRLSFSHKVG